MQLGVKWTEKGLYGIKLNKQTTNQPTNGHEQNCWRKRWYNNLISGRSDLKGVVILISTRLIIMIILVIILSGTFTISAIIIKFSLFFLFHVILLLLIIISAHYEMNFYMLIYIPEMSLKNCYIWKNFQSSQNIFTQHSHHEQNPAHCVSLSDAELVWNKTQRPISVSTM